MGVYVGPDFDIGEFAHGDLDFIRGVQEYGVGKTLQVQLYGGNASSILASSRTHRRVSRRFQSCKGPSRHGLRDTVQRVLIAFSFLFLPRLPIPRAIGHANTTTGRRKTRVATSTCSGGPTIVIFSSTLALRAHVERLRWYLEMAAGLWHAVWSHRL
jgi:hypothetical protein